jgi:hypothetical protein
MRYWKFGKCRDNEKNIKWITHFTWPGENCYQKSGN